VGGVEEKVAQQVHRAMKQRCVGKIILLLGAGGGARRFCLVDGGRASEPQLSYREGESGVPAQEGQKGA